MRQAWWLVILFPPLLLLALWLGLWWQWTLPTEDVDVLPSVVFWGVAGVFLGLLVARTGWTRRLWFGCALAVLLFVPPFIFWLFMLPLLIPVGAGCYLIARRAARGNRAWRGPLLVSLTPLLLVVATQQPIYSDYKWLWPWISFRHEILEFQAATNAVADRLGLPSDRPLTVEESELWSTHIDLTRQFRMPLTGKTVNVLVVPGRGRALERGMVRVWWGEPHPIFAWLDVRTMHIISPND